MCLRGKTKKHRIVEEDEIWYKVVNDNRDGVRLLYHASPVSWKGEIPFGWSMFLRHVYGTKANDWPVNGFGIFKTPEMARWWAYGVRRGSVARIDHCHPRMDETWLVVPVKIKKGTSIYEGVLKSTNNAYLYLSCTMRHDEVKKGIPVGIAERIHHYLS